MGGKSGGDQVTGYQYYANLVAMIGNRIEELKAINDSMITRTDIYGTEKLTVMNAIMRKRYSVN